MVQVEMRRDFLLGSLSIWDFDRIDIWHNIRLIQLSITGDRRGDRHRWPPFNWRTRAMKINVPYDIFMTSF